MSTALASRKSRALLLLWLAELGLLMLAVLLAAWLRFMRDPEGFVLFFESALPRAFVFAALITVSMVAFGLYQVHVRHNRMEFGVRLVLSFAFAGVALLVLYYLIPATYIGRGVLAMALAFGIVLVGALRLVVDRLFKTDVFRRRVLVLGAGSHADMINSRLRRNADRRSFVVVGFLPIPGQPVHVAEKLLLNTDFSLSEIAEWLQVFEIVVAPDERRGALPMEEMLKCAQRGITITDLSTFFEREAGMVKLNVADPSWLAFSGGFDHSIPRRLNKRFFDLVAAGALLLVAWPFMLAVAACIALESRGPIFYRQERTGENGRTFHLIKFRSMRVDAEADGVARWASQNDDRTTRVGRIIRLSRLDELPQLFNILRGDMSFVGPRPERPQFVDMLSKEVRYYNVRHCVRPGLTGWAQLRYPYGASVQDAEEKLTFDLFYVKNHGLVFDVLILLQTVEVVLFHRGSR
ncbi:TIGR03013 family XrtA/PEP-CTERM system glycosyltransferase [Lysobacter solisilvae (ex Woo and Kim 2020)]|uniref:TIGR03013 family PEP-CTERM/XrtA system glycosyltransferase n=1 Tax=Agrilutibacter terrestris TaxID=2865112 RepID=A0A7H0FXB4_9GAMM|nr:TIGR03013 family XrtA/PEP-CTERM system glycosyltransferase [Lysobacter terrestris]QNP40680.1 TIGR03013 family PEP-CTERM/XrtA system glycosyltransferase [Lysobacter terrestris]